MGARLGDAGTATDSALLSQPDGALIDAVRFMENLITVAHHHGIKVQALDTSITFRDEMKRHAPERSRNFKYVAHTLIETDQAHRGPHKWVALVESGHANTARNTPGLAELQGAVGVRVVDAGSQPTRVLPDEGEIVSSLLPIARPAAHRTPSGAGYLFVKSDLLLEVSTGTQLIRRAPTFPICPSITTGCGKSTE
ncbi:hypothetical protein ACLK1G_24535 [Pseudomonas sp. NR3]|uniref:hypothetical protein n=1 Tax=Pseudomonas sp. NR3 TaxID=3155978 RepID=UPI003B683142